MLFNAINLQWYFDDALFYSVSEKTDNVLYNKLNLIYRPPNVWI